MTSHDANNLRGSRASMVSVEPSYMRTPVVGVVDSLNYW